MALARIDKPAVVLYCGPLAPVAARGARHDPRRVGSGRRPRRGRSPRRAGRARAARLSRRRLLHGPLHREHDGARARLPRAGAPRHGLSRPTTARRNGDAAERAGVLAVRLARHAALGAPFLDRRRSRMRWPESRQRAARRTGSCTCSRSPTRRGSPLPLDDLAASRRGPGRHEPHAVRPLRRRGPPCRRRHAALLSELSGRIRRRHAPTVGGRRSPTATADAPSPTASGAPASTAVQAARRLHALRGNLAPEGCVVKLAGTCVRSPRPGARLRLGGGVQRGRAVRRRRARRRARRAQRGPGRRARDARDAERDRSPRSAPASASRSRSSPTVASPARRAG